MIKQGLNDIVREITTEYGEDDERDTLLEDISTKVDHLWVELVKAGKIWDYTLDDMVETMTDVATILRYAKEHAWVEDDEGLWEGSKYGLSAMVAHFSLLNCAFQAFEDQGINLNADYPLKED